MATTKDLNWNTEVFEAKYASFIGETIDGAIDRMMDYVWNPRKKHLYSQSYMRRAIEQALFIPGGRIWATAGRINPQMMNCFVIPIGDSRKEIIKALGEMFDIQAHGGGVGYNFSGLRPRGEKIKSTGGIAQGGVSFINVFDSLSGIINGVNDRKAANMGIVNDTYPDILEFIKMKASEPGKIWKNFNVSVGLQSPEFMQNVLAGEGEYWTYYKGQGINRLDAMEVWNTMMRAQWICGDPGIVNFIKIREMQNTHYLPSDHIIATNPCGEIPSPAYGVCCIGAVNLSECIIDGKIDYDKIEYAVRGGVEFLDCVLDANYYPLLEIKDHSKNVRRIGLGVMGLAHALMKCGIAYGSEESLTFIDEVWRVIATTAYSTSIRLAELLGKFPAYDDKMLDSGYMQKIMKNSEIHTTMRKHGIRNSHLLTQAPTGTTSMLAGASSGIEPLFDTEYVRHDRLGTRTVVDVVAENADSSVVVTAHEIGMEQSLKVQSAVQKWVDQSVSKTINLPEDATIEDFDKICKHALKDPYIKGITIFRDKSLPEQVLNKSSNPQVHRSKPAPNFYTAAPYSKRTRHAHLTVAAQAGDIRKVPPKETKVLASTTYHFSTPQGTSYVTLARNHNGDVEQVFIKCDKIGTDNAAWANALGRTLSIALRTGASAERLAKTLIDCQSSGIVWDDLGFAEQPLMIRSLPDAVGKLLMHEISSGKIGSMHDALEYSQNTKEGCPVCGGVTRPEGNCDVCTECGYSPCS